MPRYVTLKRYSQLTKGTPPVLYAQIAFNMRSFQQDPPVLRAYEVPKATTDYGAKQVQKAESQESKSLRQMLEGEEYDNAPPIGGGFMGAVQCILLDASAVGIASALSTEAQRADRDNLEGWVQKVLGGGRRRVQGGRRTMLSVLGHILEHTVDKPVQPTREELLGAYGVTKAEAARAMRTGHAPGPAMEEGLHMSREEWKHIGQKRKRGEETPTGPGTGSVAKTEPCNNWNNGTCQLSASEWASQHRLANAGSLKSKQHLCASWHFLSAATVMNLVCHLIRALFP